jgi:glutathione S-transferase
MGGSFAMYRLFYYPGNASLAPHMLLEELGVPYALDLVDRARDAQRSPEYLRLNPQGLIPTLVDGDLVLWETSAIMMHIADRAGFAPELGSAERAQYYKWMVHLTNTIQSEFIIYYYPERYAEGDAGIAAVKALADAHLVERFARIEAQLGAAPYLLGERLSAADFLLLMLVRWGRGMSVPPRDLPHLGRFARRMLDRPAVIRVFNREALAQPWV